jgi:hypothetical protein
MHTPEKRIEVVTKWMALGNMRLVSELTGVAYGLCRIWKQQPWWADLVAEIRASRDMQVDNKLGKLVDRSLELVGDRLENGDIIWNKKTQEYDRIPVSLAAVNKVADTLLNQQLNISKKKVIESSADTQKTVKDQIAMLAEEFAKFNTKRTVEVVSNAVHDQRKEGLQEAVRQIRWPAQEHQEAGFVEQSPEYDGEGGEGEEGGWQGRGPHHADEQGWEDDLGQSEDSEQEGQSILL